jgi:hypothetical protein
VYNTYEKSEVKKSCPIKALLLIYLWSYPQTNNSFCQEDKEGEEEEVEAALVVVVVKNGAAWTASP